MKKKIIFLLLAGLVISLATGLYLYNMPERDIAGSKSDFTLSVDALVDEFLENQQAANMKYLDESGESSIITVTGPLAEISEDFKGQTVLLLKSPSAQAGISATLSYETPSPIKDLTIGEVYRVKGVIRSGANYDLDLGMYENVILEKCEIINPQ
tara:strand:+ start:1301 stop:1765 length:465 start_codon:yes stop_codon:yes gene_type:complete